MIPKVKRFYYYYYSSDFKNPGNRHSFTTTDTRIQMSFIQMKP